MKSKMSFYKKNKFLFDILFTLVLAAGSVMYWFEYAGTEGKKMDLVTSITLGLMAVFKFGDVIQYIREKKTPGSKNNS